MSRAAPSIATPWDDPSWTEPSDTRWQAGLRWQQAWWRHHHLRVPPGPFSRSDPERLVASTVALDADAEVNFLSAEAAAAARQRLAASGGGLVKEDRLRRVLLSSQPMCFNLFGHFQSEGLRNALLPWVRMIVPSAREVARVEVEWAPRSADHFRGGSTFDAFVEVRGVDQQLSFVGIECKYHEDLKKSDVPNVRPVYRDFTIGSRLWRDGAVTQLDIRGLRQFWLNALLAQSLCRVGGYAEGHCVVMSCEADAAAHQAYSAVRSQLLDPSWLVWQPWESIVGSIDGHEDWKRRFVTRYLDFSPIAHLLARDDPRAAVGPPPAST